MNNFSRVFFGIGISIVISSLIGLVGFIFKDLFWFWFLISFIFQFLMFFVFNNIIKFIGKLKIKNWEIEITKELNKNRINMNCASCNEINSVTVNINEDNKFICNSCGVENSVIVHIANAQKTNPIYKKDILTSDDIEKLEKIGFTL